MNLFDMPEGPELKTVSDKLRPRLEGQWITEIKLAPRALETGKKAIQTGLSEVPLPVKIIQVSSHGKKLRFHLGDGGMIVSGYGMTGKWSYKPGDHTHISLQLAERKGDDFTSPFELYFDQSRPFGRIEYLRSSQEVDQYFSELGPDVLSEKKLTLEEFIARFSYRKKWENWEIIDLLLDQEFLAGIGNYLKSEILYYAGIHPRRIVKTLSRVQLEKLYEVIYHIVRVSYGWGGYTIESYISPDNLPGLYPAAIYGKTNEKCPLGYHIQYFKRTDKDRGTYWVPEVQQ